VRSARVELVLCQLTQNVAFIVAGDELLDDVGPDPQFEVTGESRRLPILILSDWGPAPGRAVKEEHANPYARVGRRASIGIV
jgi:hypothetical protein